MKRPWFAPVLIWLAVVVAAAGVVLHAKFSADMSAFLPRSPDAQQRVLVDQLRDGLVSRILMIGIDGGSQPSRAELSRQLAAALRAMPAFASVNNGQTVDLARDFEVVFAHRYLLSPQTDAQSFSAHSLHQTIADSIAQLASPMGGSLKRLLPSDPTGATLRFLSAAAPGAQPRLIDGVWFTPDGQRALLLVILRAPGTDTDAQQSALKALQNRFDALRRAAGPAADGATLVVSGPAVFAVTSRATIKDAVGRVTVIGAVLIIALLLMVYRSLPVLALGLLPVLTGVLVATAAVSLGFGVVQGITLGFGTTLMGEAVDYSIYLFVQSGARHAAGHADWLSGFWPTVRLGMLTSVVGFATLLASDFPGLAQIGAYSIAGLVTAALVTRFVLPHLLPPRFAVRDLSPVGVRLLHAVAVLRRLRVPLLLLLLAAIGVVVAQRQHIWNDRLAALSPIPQHLLDTDAELRRQIGAPDSGDLVAVSGATQDAVLQAAERLAPRLEQLQREGVIGGFDSPARYLPSAQTQRARERSLPDAATLQTNLEQAVKGLPIDAKVFAPFVQAVQAARNAPLLTRADYDGTSFALALDGMLLRGADGVWTALLPLRSPATGAIDSAAVQRALHGSGANFVDLGATSNQLYRGYLHTAAWASLAGVVGMVLLLLIALRSPLRVARVMAPLLTAVIVVVAGLTLLGVKLTLLHLVGLMLVIAVGSNYALFFDAGSRHGGIAPRTLASLVFANLTTVAGFGPLLISGVPVLTSLGATVGPGALLALLFSAILSAPQPAPSAVGAAAS